MRALEPETYKQIAKLLDERRLDRQHYIEDVKATLKRELAAAGVKAEVSGRPKHIYSIWNKMRRKQAGIDSLYDIRAVRMLVDEVKDCYAALGVVHNLWTPLPKEFDDYIAKPKANNYRSLHTAVIGPEDKPLEVQIRTHEMHRHSEYGVAAHWRYKEGVGRRPARPGLRREDRVAAPGARLEGCGRGCRRVAAAVQVEPVHRHDLRAHAAGPGGRPAARRDAGRFRLLGAYGARPSLPRRARRRRDGAAQLRADAAASRSRSSRSRTARRWAPAATGSIPISVTCTAVTRAPRCGSGSRRSNSRTTIAQGRAVVERELARAGMTALNLEAVAHEAGFAKLDDFFAAVARTEINTRQVQAAIQALAKPDAAPVVDDAAGGAASRARRQVRAAAS